MSYLFLLIKKIVLFIFVCGFSFLIADESFILIDARTNEIVLEFGPNLEKRTTPACSFNIFLSLVGYEESVLEDESNPSLDFKSGFDDFSDSWKTSHNPLSWMEKSCVWYSKILSLELGQEIIEHYLALLEYGNRDFSAGLRQPGTKNSAWLSSSLLISPKEQVTFIQKMVLKQFPLTLKTFEMTKSILFKDKLSNNWSLYGKTGLGTVFAPIKVRWFVGWIEKHDTIYCFAYQKQEIDVDVTKTVPRVKELLQICNVMK